MGFYRMINQTIVHASLAITCIGIQSLEAAVQQRTHIMMLCVNVYSHPSTSLPIPRKLKQFELRIYNYIASITILCIAYVGSIV